MSKPYLVWSYEHGGWWRPNRMGHTQDMAEAGEYTFQDALRIVHEANRYLPEDRPNEACLEKRLALAIAQLERERAGDVV